LWPHATLLLGSTSDGGWHPGSNERWAELRDDLTVSLLQARLIELGQPIRIVIDE
jgi:hypothetical protein